MANLEFIYSELKDGLLIFLKDGICLFS